MSRSIFWHFPLSALEFCQLKTFQFNFIQHCRLLHIKVYPPIVCSLPALHWFFNAFGKIEKYLKICDRQGFVMKRKKKFNNSWTQTGVAYERIHKTSTVRCLSNMMITIYFMIFVVFVLKDIKLLVTQKPFSYSGRKKNRRTQCRYPRGVCHGFNADARHYKSWIISTFQVKDGVESRSGDCWRYR